MLNTVIDKKKKEWLQSEDCPVKDLIKYMKEKGQLRVAQIEAIETYLFLKIKGENKPLWQLFAEGFFIEKEDLSKVNINEEAREFIRNNKAAHALFDFSRKKNGSSKILPELEKLIIEQPSELDYQQIIKNIFYNVEYPDYLMSLPMGAGKTFLMAAFIYLDLYFAYNEPENKVFAHNFLVLIPSGLKSSIAPSLQTIENFDPTWVIPNPAANTLKNLLKFEILDEQKTDKNSNKARNPNAQKVNQCLPNPFGQVFVVNAEKVILNRIEVVKAGETLKIEFPDNEDERDKRENELRNLIGKIPHLSIMIDEVHHAAKDDIKLRQVVNNWNKNGNISTVLGFSGTPFLSKPDKIPIGDETVIKFSKITNTVFYYPLVEAIRNFLKSPKVKIGNNLDHLEIIRKGVEEFKNEFGDKKYKNGAIAKIAIYCPSIQVLEEEVYPFLTGELKISPDEVLKYHKGNKQYPQPEGSDLEFRSLDLPISNKRYILLVQVGKEGWDCRSLTGVILSQKGDSPKNMVLQTSCRCLRQVDKGEDEKALIWLNDYNAQVLNNQLNKEQLTSIEEINTLKSKQGVESVPRYSRMEFLNVPNVDFYQLRVKYQSLEEEEKSYTEAKLNQLIDDLDNFKITATITTTQEVSNLSEGDISVIKQTGYDAANFNQWIYNISKESFGFIKRRDLEEFEENLKIIFDKITYQENGNTFWNNLYDLYSINSEIRLAFNIKRSLKTDSEVIPENASLLLVDKLKEAEKNENLYPDENDTEKIRELDSKKGEVEVDKEKIKNAFETMKESLKEQGMENFIPSFEDFSKQYDYSLAVKSKNRTFHYLPYNFIQSKFELTILQRTLQLESFKNNGLEIYYNGERGLTEFIINCYAKNNKHWKNIGRYTTDFLVIQRSQEDKIYKALMVETKGGGFKNDPVFKQKKDFVKTEFLKQNNEKFGYKRFDFLFLEDDTDITTNIELISDKIEEFFKS